MNESVELAPVPMRNSLILIGLVLRTRSAIDADCVAPPAWFVQVALTTLSTPEYSQFLIRIAVREQMALPLVIVRQANLMADAVERSLLLGAAVHEDKRSDAALRLWQAYDRYAQA